MKCAFCELKEIQARKISETKLSWAFPTNIPITVGHTLVVPKRCMSKISDLDNEELIDLFNLLKKIQSSLKKVFNAKGFNIACNEGVLAGQSVPHLHFHIVPRLPGDEGVYKYEPREFLYRPGSREPSPEKELQKVALEIKKAMF